MATIEKTADVKMGDLNKPFFDSMVTISKDGRVKYFST